MGKNDQILIGKCKKHKSIFIGGSIFITDSQIHIQHDLQGILRTGEREDKRDWALIIRVSAHMEHNLQVYTTKQKYGVWSSNTGKLLFSAVLYK